MVIKFILYIDVDHNIVNDIGYDKDDGDDDGDKHNKYCFHLLLSLILLLQLL